MSDEPFPLRSRGGTKDERAEGWQPNDALLTPNLFERSEMPDPRVCSIPECDKSAYERGLCSAHYSRLVRHGSPTAGGPVRRPAGSAGRFIETALLHKGDECLLWPFIRNKRGYAMLWTATGKVPVCRIVCERRHGLPPTPKHEAAHSCGNGHLGCVAPSHLRWATHAENEVDKIVHGTVLMGESSPASKLTEVQVREIRALMGVLSQSKIAVKYGVSRGTVHQIHHRQVWRSVA